MIQSASPLLMPLATTGFEPFIRAYVDSDFIGKVIYIALVALSFVSWTMLIYKWWIASRVHNESILFKKAFLEQKHHPLQITFTSVSHPETPNAFYMIYSVLKTKASEFIEKNRHTADSAHEEEGLLIDDFSILEAQASSIIQTITKYLERNLYILSTIVTLAPFLGLLGTVYGILVTFAGLSPDSSSGSTQQILSGLSLALTTTVIGLINAIPALIGYNAIKNMISDFEHEMERFATEILSTFDTHYRMRERYISSEALHLSQVGMESVSSQVDTYRVKKELPERSGLSQLKS